MNFRSIHLFLHKLFLGTPNDILFEPHNAFEKQLSIIKNIWQNETVDSFGLERLARLFLATTQLFFPVMLLKVLFGRWGFIYKKLAVELYLVFKIIFPFCCIVLNWNHPIIISLNALLLLETLLYLANLVFLNDITKPHSYRRALFFIFLNYIEIGLGFAALYNYLNNIQQFSSKTPFATKMEAIYFSFITSASIGFGDFTPTTSIAMFLAICQSMIYFLFVAIFMGFFISKV